MLTEAAPSIQAIAAPQKMRFQTVWTSRISQHTLQVPPLRPSSSPDNVIASGLY